MMAMMMLKTNLLLMRTNVVMVVMILSLTLTTLMNPSMNLRLKKSYQRQLVHHCDICLKLMKDFHKQSIWDEKVKLSKALDLGIAPLHYLIKSSHPIVNNS